MLLDELQGREFYAFLKCFIIVSSLCYIYLLSHFNMHVYVRKQFAYVGNELTLN